MSLTSINLGKLRWLLGHPATRRNPLSVLWGVARWEVIRLFGRGAELRLASGHVVRVSPNDGIGRAVCYFGQHDEAVAKLLSRLLADGDLVVDVGANVGTMAIQAAQHLPHGRVIAFEPNPDVFERLTHNTRAFSMIERRPMAVGAEAGLARLDLGADTARSSLNGGSSAGPGAVMVPVTTLDQEIDQEVSVLKIDVEGHDLEVLLGARRLLAERRIRHVVTEATGQRAPVIALLTDNGFTVTGIAADGSLVRDPAGIDACDNLLATLNGPTARG